MFIWLLIWVDTTHMTTHMSRSTHMTTHMSRYSFNMSHWMHTSVTHLCRYSYVYTHMYAYTYKWCHVTLDGHVAICVWVYTYEYMYTHMYILMCTHTHISDVMWHWMDIWRYVCEYIHMSIHMTQRHVTSNRDMCRDNGSNMTWHDGSNIPYVWQDAFIDTTWLEYDMTHPTCHIGCTHESGHIWFMTCDVGWRSVPWWWRKYDMTHVCIQFDILCAMTHYDWLIRATWLMHKYSMTQHVILDAHMSHAIFEPCHLHEWVISHVSISHNQSWHIEFPAKYILQGIFSTGWRRCIRCLELQVYFRKRDL